MSVLKKEDLLFISKFIISKTKDIPRRELIDILSILGYKKLTERELDTMVELSKLEHISRKNNRIIQNNLEMTRCNRCQNYARLRQKGLIVDEEIKMKQEGIKILKNEINK